MTSTDDKVLERILEQRRRRDEAGAVYRTYLRWSGRALEIPLSVVVGLGLGMLMERRWGIAPWGTWGGLFFGTATAIRAVVRLVSAYRREHPDDETNQTPGQAP